MKIGILTYHRSHNHGSFLQAYALVSRLKKEGFDAEIIDFNMKIAEKTFGKPKMTVNIFRFINQYRLYTIFEKQVKKLPLSEYRIVDDSIESLQKNIYGKYDLIIAGGDEIWRTDGFRGFPTPYWLLADFGCKKASYAVSCRSDLSLMSDSDLELIRKSMLDLDFIGVRDYETKNQMERFIDINQKVEMCCDPVFLWNFQPNRERGRKILKEKFGIDCEKKIIGFMNGNRELALELQERYNESAIVIAIYEYVRGIKNVINITSFEWIDIIAAVDVMVTSYFHGTCFSVIANVPFISMDCSREGKGKSKIYDLLNKMNLLERYVENSDNAVKSKIFKICDHAIYGGTKSDYSNEISMLVDKENPLLKYINAGLI